jgi:hypothetical protein
MSYLSKAIFDHGYKQTKNYRTGIVSRVKNPFRNEKSDSENVLKHGKIR